MLARKADLLLLVGGRICAALIALFVLRAATTLLVPEEYGKLSLLVVLQMFCGLILINPVGQYINLHTHAWWDDGSLLPRLKKYRNYVLGVSCIGALVTFAVGMRDPDNRLFANCIAVFFMVLSATWNATLVSMLNMLGYRAASVVWGVVTAVFAAGTSIALVYWHPNGTAWFIGQSVGMAVGALGAHRELVKHTSRHTSPLQNLALFGRANVLSYLLPLALVTALMWLQLSGYRFLVEWKWGLVQLGFLTLGLQLAAQLWGLVESLSMQFLYPLFYRRIGDDKSEGAITLAVSDLLNALVPVYLVFAGLIVATAPYFLKLMVAPQYFESMSFVYLGAIIELCRGLANVLSNAAQVKINTKTLLPPYAIGSAITIGLIFVTDAERLPINWVGVALLAGILGMALAMFIGMRRVVRFRLDAVRCGVAATAMLFLSTIPTWAPTLSGFLPNVAMLLVLLIFAIITLITLLKNSPAVQRLLRVQLRAE